MEEEEKEEESAELTGRVKDGGTDGVLMKWMELQTRETRTSKAVTHLRRPRSFRHHPRVLRLPPASPAFFHLLPRWPGSSSAPSVPPSSLLSPLWRLLLIPSCLGSFPESLDLLINHLISPENLV